MVDRALTYHGSLMKLKSLPVTEQERNYTSHEYLSRVDKDDRMGAEAMHIVNNDSEHIQEHGSSHRSSSIRHEKVS